MIQMNKLSEIKRDIQSKFNETKKYLNEIRKCLKMKLSYNIGYITNSERYSKIKKLYLML